MSLIDFPVDDKRGFDKIQIRVIEKLVMITYKPRWSWLPFCKYEIESHEKGILRTVESGWMLRHRGAPYYQWSGTELEIHGNVLVENRTDKLLRMAIQTKYR